MLHLEKLRDAVAELSLRTAELAGLVEGMDRDTACSCSEPRPLNSSSCPSDPPVSPSLRLAMRASEHLRAQAARHKFFPEHILRDYGWNILLDLFAHDQQEKRVSVSSACISSGGPPTTALRWLFTLEEAGLIVRIPDSEDRRRIYVELTPNGRQSIAAWLSCGK